MVILKKPSEEVPIQKFQKYQFLYRDFPTGRVSHTFGHYWDTLSGPKCSFFTPMLTYLRLLYKKSNNLFWMISSFRLFVYNLFYHCVAKFSNFKMEFISHPSTTAFTLKTVKLIGSVRQFPNLNRYTFELTLNSNGKENNIITSREDAFYF